MNGEQVKAHFEKRVNETVTQYNINPGIKGAINGILTSACGGDENRKLVLKYLCGVTSSKMLNAAQWMVLSDMVKPDKPPFGGWQAGNEKFQSAINAVLAALPKQEGQTEMFETSFTDPTPATERDTTAAYHGQERAV
jgi:hypothetical protein